MRRFVPAGCVAFLLLIPVFGLSMNHSGASAPPADPPGLDPAAAAVAAITDPATGTATGDPGIDLPSAAAVDPAAARFVAQTSPMPVAALATGAFAAEPVQVPVGIPVLQPALPPTAPSALPAVAVVASPWATQVAAAGVAPQPVPVQGFPAPAAALTGNDVAQWTPRAATGDGPSVATAPSSAGSRWTAAAPPLSDPAVATLAGPQAFAAPSQPLPSADALSAWGPPPAPLTDPRRFTEAHWQGLELVPKTPTLARMLKLPPDVPGVVVDDVTLPADLQGFQAGDLVTSVAQAPTPHLVAFIRATEQVRDEQQVRVDIVRNGEARSMVLTALLSRVGTANGDTPPMIPAGARMPHPYRGPCTNCHRIGTTGALAADQGDAIVKTAPVIRAGARRPHEDRGPCSACHTIVP